ncbi:MAG: (2Fe-2S) ferredoxin domain-containing protein [Clostridia bacterium]|jgi:NADP-reducing hydrogenase subunit HndB|nr:(2Fe-2S) ferredoxin domain-containing protein [Clostridia bacterium]
MKSLDELKEIREKALERIKVRNKEMGYKVTVRVDDCGIEKGARTVMVTFVEELNKRGISNVELLQGPCIGLCEEEPIVEIYSPNGEKTTYGQVDASIARKIVENHLINGEVVKEYLAKI